MTKYAPSSLELAPRDIVSRSIINEIDNGLGLKDSKYGDYIELSFTHLSDSVLNEKLSDIKDMTSSLLNVDISKTPLKIIPAQHYMMGGILININCETSIQNLYSAGECSCLSVHGANRLGGNSLIECLVFGKIAGEQISHYDKNTKVNVNSIDFDEYVGRPTEHYIEDVKDSLNNIDLDYLEELNIKSNGYLNNNDIVIIFSESK